VSDKVLSSGAFLLEKGFVIAKHRFSARLTAPYSEERRRAASHVANVMFAFANFLLA